MSGRGPITPRDQRRTGWDGFSVRRLEARAGGKGLGPRGQGGIAYVAPEKFTAIAQALLDGATHRQIQAAHHASLATIGKVAKTVRAGLDARGMTWPRCGCGRDVGHVGNCRRGPAREPTARGTSVAHALQALERPPWVQRLSRELDVLRSGLLEAAEATRRARAALEGAWPTNL